jgi:hypothetical protein
MINFITENLATIITMLTGIGAWGYERNRRKIEIKQFETNHNKSIMDLYQEALDDLKKRYDEKFTELEAEMQILREKLKSADERYQKLKGEFTLYKKNHS